MVSIALIDLFYFTKKYPITTLDGHSPILMSGQGYTVVVALSMPESPRNLDLGMFMSCLEVHATNQHRPKEEGIIRVAKIIS